MNRLAGMPMAQARLVGDGDARPLGLRRKLALERGLRGTDAVAKLHHVVVEHIDAPTSCVSPTRPSRLPASSACHVVVEHDGVDAARLPLLERLAHADHHRSRPASAPASSSSRRARGRRLRPGCAALRVAEDDPTSPIIREHRRRARPCRRPFPSPSSPGRDGDVLAGVPMAALPMWIDGTPTTTSHQAGMSPAPFSVATSAAVDSFVPLHFQLPPIRYCLRVGGLRRARRSFALCRWARALVRRDWWLSRVGWRALARSSRPPRTRRQGVPRSSVGGASAAWRVCCSVLQPAGVSRISAGCLAANPRAHAGVAASPGRFRRRRHPAEAIRSENSGALWRDRVRRMCKDAAAHGSEAIVKQPLDSPEIDDWMASVLELSPFASGE